MKWPKVSVVISTYNRPVLLRRALESVLGQTYRDFEVIVVDDGSSTALDVCADMKQMFLDGDVGLRLADLKENTGYQCIPKNTGIFQSQGTYIAYLDDDNVWDPEHLETLVADIERESADLSYTRWRYRGDGPNSGEDYPFCPPRKAALAGVQLGPGYNFIDTSAILHSKASVIMELGGQVWDEDIRRYGDWDLIARLAMARAKFSGIDKVTFTYWWHGENLQLTRAPNENEVVEDTVRPKWRGTGESVWRG